MYTSTDTRINYVQLLERVTPGTGACQRRVLRSLLNSISRVLYLL